MTEGLITRIGHWIDSKFEDKITRSELDELREYAKSHFLGISNQFIEVSQRIDFLRTPELAEKEIADLKTRIEKMELYSGMTRKVDPTRPPVVKSAFSM